jgi:hypothetical protein
MNDLTRSEFLKACALGACSCTAATLIPESALAQTQTKDPETEWLRGQLDKTKVRYSKLVSILDESLGQEQRRKIFDGLGRECARQTSSTTWDKYKGNIAGFLAFIKGPDGWAEQADYNPETGTIRVVDRYGCTCPLVKRGLTSGSHCDCTLGWQRETYSRILGKPVEAELEESILRGGKKCIFRMKIL